MKDIKRLFKWSKKHKLTLVLVLFLAAFSPFTYSFVPQFIKYVFDKVLANEPSNIGLPKFLINYFDTFSGIKAIFVVGIILLSYQLFRGILLFSDGFFRGKLGEEISYDIRNEMYNHIQNLSYSYHNNADTGDLIQRCTSDIELVKAFIANQTPQIVNIIAQFSFGAIQMAFINVYIAVMIMAMAPISLFLSVIFFKFVKRSFEKIDKLEATMTTTIQENVNGVRVVKAFNSEVAEINKFEKDSKEFSTALNNLIKVEGYYWSSTDVFSFLQYGLVLALSIYFSRQGILSTGDIIASLMYVGMLVWPVRNLGRIIGNFGKAVVANGRISEILEIPDEYVNDGTLESPITGFIEFRNVKYNYSENVDLLKDVSFKIKQGQTVAIVGKTGAGKSTIASLLTRLIDHDDGEILLDGVEIKDIRKHHVRKNIGLVLQDPFLFAKSIEKNISIANPSVDRQEVVKAAQSAAVHTEITKFELGYETMVGEKGVTLSGGQKQRIAIARMLLLQKPIVIFDDSLSAVDTKTDLLIRQALKNANKELTSIIITHRITTAKEADFIVVLDKGIVKEMGTHDELVKNEGLYKSLWDIQGELEASFIKNLEE